MIIKNARLIDPVNNIDKVTDILITDGKIAKIDGNISTNEDKTGETIDANGLICAPGLVDPHIHFRDPGFTYKEDIYSGAEAAKAGGVTTVILMANTKPTVDNVETLEYIINKGKETGINVLTVANVTKGMKGLELTDFDLLKQNGAVGFSDDGVPILNKELLEKAFIKAKELNVPISLHEEDPKYISNNGINRGNISEAIGVGGSPREAEISMIKRDIEIAIKTGSSVNIQHISSKEGVELVRNARKNNDNIHAEATPHHFTLTDEAILDFGTNAKMNPPLRTEEDRLAIIDGLKDGTIEIIATDHAPHAPEEKAKELTQAPSGILGLETSLALGITELVKKGYLTLSELIDRMSPAAANLYHIEDKAGSLGVGMPADMVLFDEDEKWTVEKFKSKSQNSPFVGRELTGKVKYTICAGNIVYSDK